MTSLIVYTLSFLSNFHKQRVGLYHLIPFTLQTVPNIYMIYQKTVRFVHYYFFLIDGALGRWWLFCSGNRCPWLWNRIKFWWLVRTSLYSSQISMNVQTIYIIVMSMVSAPIQMARFIALAKLVIPAMESTVQVTRSYQSCTSLIPKYFANWFNLFPSVN